MPTRSMKRRRTDSDDGDEYVDSPDGSLYHRDSSTERSPSPVMTSFLVMSSKIPKKRKIREEPGKNIIVEGTERDWLCDAVPRDPSARLSPSVKALRQAGDATVKFTVYTRYGNAKAKLVSVDMNAIVFHTMKILVGIKSNTYGFWVAGEGSLPPGGPFPSTPSGTILLGSYERDRPVWNDRHSASAFIERVAQTALHHPFHRAEMGGIEVARHVALYYYGILSQVAGGGRNLGRKGELRRENAAKRLRECWQGSVFAVCAERRFFRAMLRTEALIPDLLALGDWPVVDSVRNLYIDNGDDSVLLYRDKAWADKSILKMFIFYHEFTNEKLRRTGRKFVPQAVPLPEEYWDKALPAVKLIRQTRQNRQAVFPFMLPEGKEHLATATLDPAPTLDENYPSISELMRSTIAPLKTLKRKWPSLTAEELDVIRVAAARARQRRRVKVHKDDDLAYRFVETAKNRPTGSYKPLDETETKGPKTESPDTTGADDETVIETTGANYETGDEGSDDDE